MTALEKSAVETLRTQGHGISIWNCYGDCKVQGVKIMTAGYIPMKVKCPVCSTTLKIAL